MALDKDILGQALYDVEQQYNDVDISDADLPAKRLEMNIKIAEAIINHIKQYGEGKYQVGTLTAGSTGVTAVGTAATIKIL